MGSPVKPLSSKGKSRDKARKGKGGGDIPDLVLTQRDRLHQALSLGIRFDDTNQRKWRCTDAVISGRAVGTMSAFVDIISPNLLHHSLIKDSFKDMLVALEGILESENEIILRPATNISAKLFACLGSSLCQYYVLRFVFRLSRLLVHHQLQIAISSAASLKCILRNIEPRSLKNVWAILEETNAVSSIIHSLLQYEGEVQSPEHFTELVSLLQEMLRRWPPVRYSVWSNKKLMSWLGTLCANIYSPLTADILRLFSALALCDNIAVELIGSKEPFLSNLLLCMGCSVSSSIRIESLVLCQHLMKSEKACLLLTSLCCKPIVQGIINAMGGWKSTSDAKVPPEQMPLVIEACRAAQITYWFGKHHRHFWENGVVKVLVGLLLGNHDKFYQSPGQPSFEEMRTEIYHSVPELRDLIWNIIGWLSMNCVEEYCSKSTGKMHCLDVLISCVCSVSVDGMFTERRSQYSSSHIFPSSFDLKPALRATLWMVFSPCKYIASCARRVLSQMLQHADGSDYLEYILEFLGLCATKGCMVAPENALLVRLMALTCYSTLPEHQSIIHKRGGLNTLLAIINQRLSVDKPFIRSSTFSHLHHSFIGMSCCLSNKQDVEVEDIFLLHTLQALSQLIHHSSLAYNHQTISLAKVPSVSYDGGFNSQALTESLLQMLDYNFSRRVKWYLAYCLSFCGLYGFPSKFGKRMKKALDEKELADLQLILANKQSIGVHRVILMARCQALLPPEESSEEHNFMDIKVKDEVHLSGRVERSTLEKLLEYVYTGFCLVDDNLVQSLRILSKSCCLDLLHYMLQRKLPVCASPLPRCDFTKAFSLSRCLFSDVILEAKETEASWSCSMCQLSIPHMHAHKIILCLSSTYYDALFQSGMQESSSPTIKVPISFKALVKLLNWFYSGELPKLDFNCAWFNLDKETQLDELLIYLELSELAEFWCLDEVREESIHVIVSCLRLSQNFPIKIIEFADNLRQREIVEVGVSCLAPSYPQLCDSGELEEFGKDVVEMIRREYVRRSVNRLPSD